MNKKIKNSVHLTGNAGAAPEIIIFPEGKRLAKVSIAVNESFKIDGKDEKRTHWFNLVFWNDKVKLVEDILLKGGEISIQGKLSTYEFTDNSDQKRTGIEIIVFEVLSLTNPEK
nr:single-stranded DNA-binding protein [uncultured Pedobacter sp.]